jgi:hypothetical protein
MVDDTHVDDSHKVRARVISHTPGRLRVRLAPDNRAPRTMHAIGQRLEGTLGPGRVEVSPMTGSVLMRYDGAQSSADMMRILRDVGVVLEETVRDIVLEVPTGGSHSTTGDRIVDAMTDLDRQLAALTGRRIDLKVLFPLSLGAVALWRAARSGLGLNQVPPYVLLWYAFDSFWKFHHTTTVTAADAQDGQADGQP